MAAAELADPGIIGLKKNGSLMTTHFRLDLFQPDGQGNNVLAINSGEVTLSGGFAGSLAAAIGIDPTLKFDLGASASMEIIADVDDLIALAMALDSNSLSLADFFAGSGIVNIVIDEPDPSKLALLAEIAGLELLGLVTEITPPVDGGTLNLPLSVYDPGVYTDALLQQYTALVIIGTGAEITDFRTQGSGVYDIPDEVLDLVSEYQVTTGYLALDAAIFSPGSTDTAAFTPIGDSGNSIFAQVVVNGDVADYVDQTPGFLADRLDNFSNFGVVSIQVQDTAANITAEFASLGPTIDGLDAQYQHHVQSPTDVISTFDGSLDYIYFENTALVPPGLVLLPNNFEFDLDLFDISAATGVFSYDEMSPARDFSFIGATQLFNNHDIALGESGKQRIDIRLVVPGSTAIEFDGLVDDYDGTIDFVIAVPNDVTGTLDVRDFFGIPATDRISYWDFEDSILIPDAELMRFDDLTLVDDASRLHQFQQNKLYFPEPRDFLVGNVESSEGDFLVGDAGPNTLLGDGADPLFRDVLFGDAGNDILDGGQAGDDISGDQGNDSIDAGTGDDYVEGGSGDDSILGGDGSDELIGNYALLAVVNAETDNDTIYGGNGNDLIDGKFDADVLFGDAGIDTILGGSGDDMIMGGADDDEIYGDNFDGITAESDNDTIYGGDGDDEIFGSYDNDAIIGPGLDDDLIYGDAGMDSIFASNGNDTIYGGIGDDDLYGQIGDDFLYGEDGDDEIYPSNGLGDVGNDFSSGGAGNDQIYDTEGDDTLMGGSGNDSLEGGDGDDMVYGDDGVDDLDGNGGNDFISGGEGVDVLRGGLGNDIFSFALLNDLGDTILDFSPPTTSYSSVVDLLALDLGIWGTGSGSGNPIFRSFITFQTFIGSVTVPHVSRGPSHLHVLRFATKTTGIAGFRQDWRISSLTLGNVPLAADLTVTGSNEETAFLNFLTARSATIEQQGFATTPVIVTGFSGPSTTFTTVGTTLTGTPWEDGVGVYVAFGRVNNHLLMATVRNSGTKGITAAEVGTIHTVAILNGDPANVPALLTDTIIVI